jgi:hypothetical protein
LTREHILRILGLYLLVFHNTMDFLSSFIAVALTHWFSASDVEVIHKNYCENLYFQPDAEIKLSEYGCDIYEVSREVARVKSGRY